MKTAPAMFRRSTHAATVEQEVLFLLSWQCREAVQFHFPETYVPADRRSDRPALKVLLQSLDHSVETYA